MSERSVDKLREHTSPGKATHQFLKWERYMLHVDYKNPVHFPARMQNQILAWAWIGSEAEPGEMEHQAILLQ